MQFMNSIEVQKTDEDLDVITHKSLTVTAVSVHRELRPRDTPP